MLIPDILDALDVIHELPLTGVLWAKTYSAPAKQHLRLSGNGDLVDMLTLGDWALFANHLERDNFVVFIVDVSAVLKLSKEVVELPVVKLLVGSLAPGRRQPQAPHFVERKWEIFILQRIVDNVENAIRDPQVGENEKQLPRLLIDPFPIRAIGEVVTKVWALVQAVDGLGVETVTDKLSCNHVPDCFAIPPHDYCRVGSKAEVGAIMSGLGKFAGKVVL